MCEPSVATVAHLCISARNLLSYIVKSSIFISGETEEQSILFLGPGLLVFFVTFTEKVFSGDNDLL